MYDIQDIPQQIESIINDFESKLSVIGINNTSAAMLLQLQFGDTCATLLLYKGVSLTTVQKILGHKSVKTTQISYAATLSFSSNNTIYGAVSQSAAYIKDWRDLETPEGEIRVIPIAVPGYMFSDWGYKNPGSTTWQRVPDEYINDEKYLLLNNSQAEKDFVDGTKFVANFVAISGGGGDVKHTVIIRAAEWDGRGWIVSSDASYGIGWLDQIIGKTSITKQFNKTEVCTFWYGSGSSNSGFYEAIEITDLYGTKVGNVNSKGQFSFPVTKDVIYYVKYAYKRND